MVLFSIRIKNTYFLFLFSLFLSFISCGQNNPANNISAASMKIVLGAEQTERYFPLIAQKNIGLVANQTSVINLNDSTYHMVDVLLEKGHQLKKIFSPEFNIKDLQLTQDFLYIYDGKQLHTFSLKLPKN